MRIGTAWYAGRLHTPISGSVRYSPLPAPHNVVSASWKRLGIVSGLLRASTRTPFVSLTDDTIRVSKTKDTRLLASTVELNLWHFIEIFVDRDSFCWRYPTSWGDHYNRSLAAILDAPQAWSIDPVWSKISTRPARRRPCMHVILIVGCICLERLVVNQNLCKASRTRECVINRSSGIDGGKFSMTLRPACSWWAENSSQGFTVQRKRASFAGRSNWLPEILFMFLLSEAPIRVQCRSLMYVIAVCFVRDLI